MRKQEEEKLIEMILGIWEANGSKVSYREVNRPKAQKLMLEWLRDGGQIPRTNGDLVLVAQKIAAMAD